MFINQYGFKYFVLLPKCQSSLNWVPLANDHLFRSRKYFNRDYHKNILRTYVLL